LCLTYLFILSLVKWWRISLSVCTRCFCKKVRTVLCHANSFPIYWQDWNTFLHFIAKASAPAFLVRRIANVIWESLFFESVYCYEFYCRQILIREKGTGVLPLSALFTWLNVAWRTAGRTDQNETSTATCTVSIDRERCYGFQSVRGHDMSSRKRSWEVSTGV
jgi:hypothetical protein